MPDLLGIISPLKKFLSDTEESIKINKESTETIVLSLRKDREYNIPDFQREIRWDEDNIAILIDDLESGPKYLGNIILTQHPNNKFSIIDGQQRITTLTMILTCIRKLHSPTISVIKPCKLNIESFPHFSDILLSCFSESQKNDTTILESDKLHQIETYYKLWSFIIDHPAIKDKTNAIKISENLEKSQINILLNRSDDTSDSIRYFIDVNLKGKQLDTEDIFKSYLFKNDPNPEIREA